MCADTSRMAHGTQNSNEDRLSATTLQTIGAVSKLPVVRVDREAFLHSHFGDSPHLERIIEQGPQSVYSTESLRRKASHRSQIRDDPDVALFFGRRRSPRLSPLSAASSQAA